MAIVKMKSLRLIVPRSEKKRLLRDLTRLGCVQVVAAPEAAEDTALLHRETSRTAEWKSRQSDLARAITVLGRYDTAKHGLLTPKDEVSEESLLDESGFTAAAELASRVDKLDGKLKKLTAEESRLNDLRETVTPWLSSELSFDRKETARCAVVAVTLPIKTDLAALDDALHGVTEEAELLPVSEDERHRYFLLLCMKEDRTAVLEALRAFDFAAAPVDDLHGTARENEEQITRRMSELAKEREACTAELTELAAERRSLMLASDRIGVRIAQAQAEEQLLATDSAVLLCGWFPAEREDALEALLQTYDCAWETDEPTEDEYPEVPVALKNNRFTDALNMVTNMYSLPAYGTVDPNPAMAPFFLLFYGLMMADIGYGLLMIVAALVAGRKLRPRGGTLSFCRLLLYGGIATLLMGVLTGGFFGDMPYQLVHLFHPESTWQGLPYLFSPVQNSELVLYGAMGLGMLHLNTGMAINFAQKVKAGNVADAVWEEGSLWVLLLGAILALCKIGTVAGVPVVLAVGIVMLLFGAGRNAKGIGKLTAAFSCIYNTATGWFGDVLSYSRIMALMLAGGVVAQVFNTIAALPAQGMGTNVLSVTIFFVIALIGHALNFALNLLGCFVHDLRLQCLEFFGKFYTDGGKPFAPLKASGKYMQAVSNKN